MTSSGLQTPDSKLQQLSNPRVELAAGENFVTTRGAGGGEFGGVNMRAECDEFRNRRGSAKLRNEFGEFR